MLEVCFSDSAKGGLAVAQHCGGDVIGGAVSFVTDRKGLVGFFAKRRALREYRSKREELRKIAVPLGGRREDIIGLSFGLSEGDIASPILDGECPRRELLRSWFCFDRHDDGEDYASAADELWEHSLDGLHRLEAQPEEIRVWVDNIPDTRCGLLFVADILRDSKTSIHIVELPERFERGDGTAVRYRGWGEVDPELFGFFAASCERVLTSEEIVNFSEKWRQLQVQNAPLRVIKDGDVASADLSWYDDLIRREFPDGSCRAAEIIGRALGRQGILTGDVFVAKRLQHFIEAGELAVVSDGSRGFYSTVLRRA
jgi:hypothetical protein